MSSSIPSWQILTAPAQPFRGARDLAFCLKVPLDSLLVWASSGGSGETAHMRRLAWTFAARICDKYEIRLTRPICDYFQPMPDCSAAGRCTRQPPSGSTPRQYYNVHALRVFYNSINPVVIGLCVAFHVAVSRRYGSIHVHISIGYSLSCYPKSSLCDQNN